MTFYTCLTSTSNQHGGVKVKDVGHLELRRSVGHVLVLKSIYLRAGRIYGPPNILKPWSRYLPVGLLNEPCQIASMLLVVVSCYSCRYIRDPVRDCTN